MFPSAAEAALKRWLRQAKDTSEAKAIAFELPRLSRLSLTLQSNNDFMTAQTAFRRLLLDQLLGVLDDVGDADAELLERDGAGGGGAEAIDTDDRSVVADVLVPAHGGAGFDGELGRVPRGTGWPCRLRPARRRS